MEFDDLLADLRPEKEAAEPEESNDSNPVLGFAKMVGKTIGRAACAGAANGFVSGSATAAITAAAAKGAFGETVKAAAMGSRGANIIASLVVLTMETCRNSYLVASGQIEPVEMASNMGQSVFSTVMMLGGAAVATALTGGAALPVLIGSFVGGAAGSMAFRPVSSCVMKVCVDSGVTFFGLVEARLRGSQAPAFDARHQRGEH